MANTAIGVSAPLNSAIGNEKITASKSGVDLLKNKLQSSVKNIASEKNGASPNTFIKQ